METPSNDIKIGRFRRSWELTKSSWRVLKLDKKLLFLPAFGLLVTIALGVGLSWLLIATLFGSTHSSRTVVFHGHWALVPIIVVTVLELLIFSTVNSLFSGAIVFGANERFNGRKPTLRASLKGCWRRLDQLTRFNLLSITVGGLAQTLSNRIPFVGKLIGFLGLTAWSVTTVFAVPIIVLGDKPVGPFEAVKQSSKMLRRVWGEGLMTQLGIGLVVGLGFLVYLGLVIFGNAELWSSRLSIDIVGPAFLLSILGGLLLLVIFAVLSSIARTALYYYATTGEAPELFNKHLLHASMTVKRARRLFA